MADRTLPHDATSARGQAGPRRTPSRGRVWPTALLLLMVLAGMVYSFYWNRLSHHSASWNTPSDIWKTFRAAQYVTWGGESQIYNNPAAFQTFPGIAVLLAPIAQIASVLHLTTSFPLVLARPSAWLLLGPVEIALAGVVLYPLDTLAIRLGIAERRRIHLVVAVAIVVWPSVAVWGHPEDALSLALGIMALLAALDGAWLRMTAVLGLAIVVQPLIILVVPMMLAYVPPKRWAQILAGVALPTLLLLISPLVQEWSPTTRILLRQPNFPTLNHPTPWMAHAPIITAGYERVVMVAKYLTLPNGQRHLVEASAKVFVAPVVAAGPGRIIAIVMALAIGVLVKARRPALPVVVWLAALSLSLRCVFEPVMVPYYLMAGLALALIASARARRAHFVLVGVAVALCTFLSYLHLGPWPYYLAMTSSLALVFATSWPRDGSTERSDVATPAHLG